MNINFDKIENIYGKDTINNIVMLKEDVINNFKYFVSLDFNDPEDIFERQVPIFVCSNDEFKKKLNNLISKLGNNYIEKIENDISLLDELL